MEPFTLQVLGGTFTVQEIVPQDGQSEEETLQMMREVPAERWFVVLEEQDLSEDQDALAVIDDDLEFCTLAKGVFEGEL